MEMGANLSQISSKTLGNQVRRRRLLLMVLGTVCLLGVQALIGCSSPAAPAATSAPAKSDAAAAPAKVIKARLGHGQAVTHPVQIMSEKFAEMVKERSKGQLEIALFPGAQLGGSVEMAEAVRLGTVEMYFAGNAWIEGIAPTTGVVNLPGIFRDSDHAYKTIFNYANKEIYDKALVPLGVRPVAYVSNEFRHVTNSKRPLNTLADLKGLKFRVPNSKIFSDTMAAMGGSPVPIDWSEVFGALQQGVVDGQENPLMNIYTAKLYEVQGHLALTSHMWDVYPLLMNEQFFQSLDPELQDIVLQSGREASDVGWAEVKKQTDELLDKLKKGGMKVTELDKQEVQNSVKGVWKGFESRIGAEGTDMIQKIQAIQ